MSPKMGSNSSTVTEELKKSRRNKYTGLKAYRTAVHAHRMNTVKETMIEISKPRLKRTWAKNE